ncbi:NADAR family protein, partial [Marinobacter alexandrii]
MTRKVAVYGGTTRHHQIMASSNPAQQQAPGRAVSGFDDYVWVRHRLSIVRQAKLNKFDQNPELVGSLLGTGNKILAEACPFGIIWGIGFRAEDPQAYQPSFWKGSNLLGCVLMSVRQDFSPPSSSPS